MRATIALTKEAEALVEAIKPVLAGQSPAIQGAALADCLAIYIAGHYIPGDPAATAELRGSLLDHHIAAVKTLVEINARMMGTDS